MADFVRYFKYPFFNAMIADLNDDGKADIVVCNNVDNNITIIWSK